jgi:hypothetical protein
VSVGGKKKVFTGSMDNTGVRSRRENISTERTEITEAKIVALMKASAHRALGASRR